MDVAAVAGRRFVAFVARTHALCFAQGRQGRIGVSGNARPRTEPPYRAPLPGR